MSSLGHNELTYIYVWQEKNGDYFYGIGRYKLLNTKIYFRVKHMCEENDGQYLGHVQKHE